MKRVDSVQIELVRIICITAMMWVHIAPGLGVPSYVNGGPADPVGEFFGNALGRVSVTTLSFISGYLFWKSGVEKPLTDVCRRLFFVIYLPMLVWSALFLALVLVKVHALGQSSTAADLMEPGAIGLINAWSGLAGPTANLSLFFIRDLLVATLVVRALAPLIRRSAPAAFILALGAVLLPDTSPVLFRPTILTFVLFGAIAASRGFTIAAISTPWAGIGASAGLSIAVLVLVASGPHRVPFIDDLVAVMYRAGLGLPVLVLARVLSVMPRLQSLAEIGRHSFLAYLMHAPLIGILWAAWSRLHSDPGDPAYLAFFLVTPPLAFAAAVFLGGIVDRAPDLLQILLRGRIFSIGGSRIREE